ncbi:MAG: putative 2OG-Fe(II) oxygenase, partial [Pseudohongiella nitratireducens]|nr:putative 2OG-Fe(II) oxygenase [Pseudohongiella nitratireducens]
IRPSGKSRWCQLSCQSGIQMRPEEGRLYVFPGWLEHGVEENRSDRDRLSISFNVLAASR